MPQLIKTNKEALSEVAILPILKKVCSYFSYFLVQFSRFSFALTASVESLRVGAENEEALCRARAFVLRRCCALLPQGSPSAFEAGIESTWRIERS